MLHAAPGGGGGTLGRLGRRGYGDASAPLATSLSLSRFTGSWGELGVGYRGGAVAPRIVLSDQSAAGWAA
eukprot:scaffold70199_cov58-Phaeocystis_antarctica.AAC.2